MRSKAIFMLWLLAIVLILPGCFTQEMREEQIRAEAEAKAAAGYVPRTGEHFYFVSLYVIGNEVYYTGDSGFCRLSEPSTPIRENTPGLYSEAHELFYKLSDGALTSFDPVTGSETAVCNVDTKDASLKCITENYAIFGATMKSFSLNLSDLSIAPTKHVFRSTDEILTADGDTVYFSNADGAIYSYDIESGTATAIYEGELVPTKAAVHGDSFYLAPGYMYCVTGLKGGELSEAELVEEAFAKGNVIALAGYDEGIYFICHTRKNTLDLWQLPDGGEAEKLSSWDDVYYYFKGSGRLSVSDSLVACCVATDDKCRIFTYDLESEQEGMYYAK